MNPLLIIQPWFSARGHPAQSLLNTARALGNRQQIQYMVSRQSNRPDMDMFHEQLRELGCVDEFPVHTDSVREGTLKALLYLLQHRRQFKDSVIFFTDGHLVTLVLFWLVIGWMIPVRKVSLLYLKGPERIVDHAMIRWFTCRFLGLQGVTLYLRTQELAEAWLSAFPQSQSSTIRTLPTLELYDVSPMQPSVAARQQAHFGVLGQIRRGKGLEWLIPMFEQHPSLGQLNVAGTFFSDAERDSLPMVCNYKGFRDEFLSEQDLLDVAGQQDYLLVLYDDWDSRMESAVLFLAARVGRPVIAYDEGWCGRKVREFGCGFLLSKQEGHMKSKLADAPRPGSEEYAELCEGMHRFVAAHSGDKIRDEFLSALVD